MEKTLNVSFKFFKDISFWSNESGQGVKANGAFDDSRWSIDVSYMNKTKTLTDINEVEDALKEVLRENYLPDDYIAIMDEGRLSFNTIEDKDNIVLDEDEQNRIEEKGEQLYICDYDVMVEIFTAFEPSVEQLKTLFPMAEQMA